MTLQEAVESIKNRDARSEQAFRVIYEETRCTALAVIKRYCDIPGDYEDLLQETYIRVYKSIHTLKDDTKAAAWIRTIAGNTAIRHNMKKWPTMFSDMADEEGNIPDFEDESISFNPEAIADRKAVSEVVSQILDSLPYDQRTALWMVYGQQVPIKEMAQTLGISENTIKSRLYQGRQKLMARKEDFRRCGIELTAIPVSALVAMAFQDTVYASEMAGTAAFSLFGANRAKVARPAGAAGKIAAASVKAKAAATVAGIGAAAVIAAAGYQIHQNRQNRQAEDWPVYEAKEALESENSEGMRDTGDAKIQLTAEEKALLDGLMALEPKEENRWSVYQYMFEHFDELYRLCEENMGNGSVVYNGTQELMEGSGKGIALKASRSKINENMGLACYVGTFIDGFPDGDIKKYNLSQFKGEIQEELNGFYPEYQSFHIEEGNVEGTVVYEDIMLSGYGFTETIEPDIWDMYGRLEAQYQDGAWNGEAVWSLRSLGDHPEGKSWGSDTETEYYDMKFSDGKLTEYQPGNGDGQEGKIVLQDRTGSREFMIRNFERSTIWKHMEDVDNWKQELGV